jgi:hypothetical protein
MIPMGGQRKKVLEVNMIEVHHMHLCKSENETLKIGWREKERVIKRVNKSKVHYMHV